LRLYLDPKRTLPKASGITSLVYTLHIEDNGCGIPKDVIPLAFGKVLFGSKYSLKQTRGPFGLGGKMAILYGQITTHQPVHVISSTGGAKVHEYILSIDIQKNEPIIKRHRVHRNKHHWHGTVIDLQTEGDFSRVQSRVIEYLKQTAIVVPSANIIFIDPKGGFYVFKRATTDLPKPPQETNPHPYGVDVETIQRMTQGTKTRTMHEFMRRHFQRVGPKIADNFLSHAGVNRRKNPSKLTSKEIVDLVNALKCYNRFLPPDASCLSPIGEDLLEVGIKKEFSPEFVAACQRKPSSYSGYPFIVEAGIAYGGVIPKSEKPILYRFANHIPLLFDEGSDVASKVINESVDWRHYKISSEAPIAIFTHICSIKIPYKTVGKEFVADRPEVERELTLAIREVARRLSIYLSRQFKIKHEKERLTVFQMYLPKIATFATKLAGKKKELNIKPLLKQIRKYSD